MGFFSNDRFTRSKRQTMPVYQTPSCVREALDITTVHRNGIFEIGRPEGEEHVYDRCYSFEDINYAEQDAEKQQIISLQFCQFLNAMNTDFKIITALEEVNKERAETELMCSSDQSEYRDLIEHNNELVQESLKNTDIGLKRRHYLIIAERAKSMEEAETRFNVLDETIMPIFESFGTRLEPLDTVDRLMSIRRYFFSGEEERILTEVDIYKSQRDWRNDLLPGKIENRVDSLEFHGKYVSHLYAYELPGTLNEEKTMSKLTDFRFPIIVTLDTACLPRSAFKERLDHINQANDVAINSESEAQSKAGNYTGMISLRKRRTKKVVEETLDNVDQNDENSFFLGVYFAVFGNSKEELKSNISMLKIRADTLSIKLMPCHYQQLQAMNTVLPIGARRTSFMRTMLTTSYVAFQPFHAFDLIQPSGYWYGINKRTKNVVMGDRKTLKSGNGVIMGHTGSGKSMLLKITEIGQTLIRTRDDVFMIDPQNEMEGIVPVYGGEFFDLSATSGIGLNPLETPEQILYSTDDRVRTSFIAEQSEFVEAFMYSILNMEPNGMIKTLVYRAVYLLYEKTFSMKKPVSPLLSELREIFGTFTEPEARLLFMSLEAYTDYAYQTLAKQSSFKTTKRFVVFGLHGVPENMWEPIMLTVMHVLSQRMSYNQTLQRATHFIVDEAQYVCTHESSALELQKAYLTYRKYGGICTICLQNAAAAFANTAIQNIVSNSDFKLILDQGGNDRNLLTQIVDLSEKEFQELASETVGQSLLVWGKQIIPLDSRISKNSPLYALYTTNFHEKAAKTAELVRK